MGKTIEFNTGRGYSPDGQVIKAEAFNGEYDREDFDWFDPKLEDEKNEPYVVFEDTTRMIKGKLRFCELSEEDIMKKYDNGDYTDV